MPYIAPYRSQLRPYNHAYAYRGLTAFATLSMAVSDSAVGNYGNSSGGSVASMNPVNDQIGNNNTKITDSQNIDPQNMTTGERIAGSSTTEERLMNRPNSVEKQNSVTETTAILADETKRVESTWENLRSYPEINKRVFDLVMRFRTSKSPKRTRSSTTYKCPGRPGH
ncbi:MAG: hypothetical protein ABW170_16695 [Candidatus Thiodiazotropha sp. L084R]